jgi:hypothetical protein
MPAEVIVFGPDFSTAESISLGCHYAAAESRGFSLDFEHS